MKDVWGALNDPTRRKILTLLKKRDLTAGEICEEFKTTGATISHHLSILKETDLINAKKNSQTIVYSLNTTVFQGFLKTVAEFFGKGEEK